MKQGRASLDTRSGTKTEPKAHAVCPGAVDQLGQATAFKKETVYQGRGLEAPMKGTQIHHCGSQGKH